MTRGDSDISRLAFRAFIRTYGIFRTRMDPYFTQFGISAAQWAILRQLHRAEDEGLKGLQLSDLGRRLWVKPPSVTTLIDRLERSGWVARTTSARDLRAKQVKLTASGRKLVARVLRKHPTQIRTVLAGLSRPEQREMHRLLEKFAAHLETLGNGKSRTNGSHTETRQRIRG